MFCDKCGKEIKKGKFCSFCGAEQVEEEFRKENFTEGTQKDAKENKNNNFDIKGNQKKDLNKSVVAIIAVVLICAVAFLLLKQSKSEKFIELLKIGDYEQAVTYYQSELVGDEKEVQKVYEAVTKEINSLVEAYYADSISYNDAKNELNTYSTFYSTETESALQEVEKLKESKDMFEMAETKIEEEDYRSAYELYAKVIETDSNFQTAQEKMNECYSIVVDQAFALGETAASEGNYLSAIEQLGTLYSFFSSDDQNKADSKMQAYLQEYVASIEEQVEICLIENNYSECFDILYGAMNLVENNSTLESMLQDVTKTYEAHISELVNIEINERDFIGAADILNTAKGELLNSEAFAQLTIELAEYTPVSIYNLEPYAVGIKIPQHSNYKDTMGNVYNKTFRIVSSSGYYNVYDISQKYSVLTGVIAVPNESVGAEGNGYVRVYGDNVLLWEDNNITATTKPYEMSVNISGVTDLKIEMGGAKGYQGVHVLFADVTLQK